MRDAHIEQQMIVDEIKRACLQYVQSKQTQKQLADKIDPQLCIMAAWLTGMAAAAGTLAQHDGSPIVTGANILAAVNTITNEIGFTMSRGSGE